MNEKLVVVKFGSELVADGDGIDHKTIDRYAARLAKTYKDDDLIIVTSGAVAAGIARETKKGRSTERYDDVTLAQLGSASIMRAWEEGFDRVDMSAGGLLVTHHEMDQAEGPSFLRALTLARERRVVSVLNENDALSDDELMELACGGDNDGLASHVARAAGASALILFTKRGGVTDEQGKLITQVNSTNVDNVRIMLSERAAISKTRGSGRGGIIKKFDAAVAAANTGISVKIAAINSDMTGERVTEFVIG